MLTINGYRPERVETLPDWLSRRRKLQEISRRRHEGREEVGEKEPVIFFFLKYIHGILI